MGPGPDAGSSTRAVTFACGPNEQRRPVELAGFDTQRLRDKSEVPTVVMFPARGTPCGARLSQEPLMGSGRNFDSDRGGFFRAAATLATADSDPVERHVLLG